ncbi:hypothetical protein PIB30_025967 [Stylosanthes scabra]|uniref:Aminotransferase-like plant mobile domain-containing protein n=1 Tax=Stylosanthes scabra TaxID=79078 RepID=A0ABU6SAH9_9FABA|nr:hypothetical protein [Stylosanthes scabra]
MSRHKTTIRKRTGASHDEPPPPLSQLPLRKWFTTNKIWKSYLDTFSKLPILKPRYLPESLIPEDKYEGFWKVVDQQGLRPLLYMKERRVFLYFVCYLVDQIDCRYYPRMMAVVATTLQLKDNLDDVGNEEFYLRFWIAGVTYTITLGELASLWGLRSEGLRFTGGSSLPRKYAHWDGKRSQDTLQISKIGGGKYSVGKIKTDHRLLHYMLSYLWLPRKGNHGVLTEEDAFILRVMVEEVKLNWPYFLAHRMMRYTNNSWESHLGHGMLWTKVFEQFNLDLSGEEVVEVGEENEITVRHVNKMCRGAVVVGKCRRKKAVVEDTPSHSGTGPDTQVTPELMEAFADGIHSFNTGWDEKTERADKRLSIVEGRVSSQADEIQSLWGSMRLFLSRNA